MPNKYKNIQTLITLWQDYERDSDTPEMEGFSDWLKEKMNSENEPGNKNDIHQQDPADGDYTKISRADQRMDFMHLVSRLARFQDFYVKRLFEGLPIHSMLEFHFLMSINKNVSSKKKEIIDSQLVEYTTGIDIVKRLIRLKLVTESTDLYDKRNKRLKITPEGKKVVIDTLLRIKKIENYFLLDASSTQFMQCLSFLRKMEEFHFSVYAKNAGLPNAELIDMVGYHEEESHTGR